MCMKYKRVRKWSAVFILIAIVVAGICRIPDTVYAADINTDPASEELQSDASISEKAEYHTADNVADQGLDVIFCIDNSRSIWSQQAIRDQAVRALVNLAANRNVKVGGVYFADHVYKQHVLTSLDSEKNLDELLNDFLNLSEQSDSNRDTNIGKGLKACQDMFVNQDDNRRKIIVLFSDGINENYEQEKAYKDSADALTEKKVKELQGYVDIYCVYLEKDNDYSNQEYLKKIVNYFEDTTDNDDRFMAVADSEIDSLCNRFVDVFYAVQNNMKYSEFICDSSGKYTFHVPDTNVSSVQIFLKNVKEGSSLQVTCNGEAAEVAERVDGTLRYITIDSPAAADWQITAEAALGTVSGTLAFYADVQSAFSIHPVEEAAKGRSGYVEAAFADSSGAALETLDPAASVHAVVTADGAEIWSGDLEQQGSYYRGEEFELSEYGSYEAKLSITYRDFLNLQYSGDSFTIEPQAPIARAINGQFSCYKVTENGINCYQYTFSKEDLFYDPEGETVSLVEYRNLNPENPADVTESGDKFIITSEKTGQIEVELTAVDESDRTVTTIVKGKMISETDQNNMIIRIIVIIAVLLIFWFFRSRKKKAAKNGYKQKLILLNQEYEQAVGRLNAYRNRFVELSRSYDGAEFSHLQENLKKSSEALLTAQLRYFGIEDMVKDEEGCRPNDDVAEAEKSYKEADRQLTDALKQSGKGRFAVPTEREVKRFSVRTMANMAEGREEAMLLIRSCLRTVQEKSDTYKDAVKAASERAALMEEKLQEIRKLGKDPFRCQIHYRYIYLESQPVKSYLGVKDLTAEEKGFFGVDQLRVLTKNGMVTLEELAGESCDVVIYPYSDPEDGDGILLKSLNEFSCREDAEVGFGPAAREAVLLKGRKYKLNIPALGKLEITVME